MFYKNKILFFIILGLISLILYYFIDQQLVLIGLLNNRIISIGILFFLILFFSFTASVLITFFIVLFLKLYGKIIKTKLRYSKRFIIWLTFTIAAYIISFIIFFQAITY